MRSKSSSRAGREARRVSVNVKQLVLHESGYRCGNPCCRHPLTLDVHHLLYVSEAGASGPDNLLPLCPNCHAMHHRNDISTDSLRAWKMLLLGLNQAFDRRSIDMLLAIDQLKGKEVKLISGDGVFDYAPLIASGLVCVRETWLQTTTGRSGQTMMYTAQLTEKGQLFLEGWKKGNQEAAIVFGDSVAGTAKRGKL